MKIYFQGSIQTDLNLSKKEMEKERTIKNITLTLKQGEKDRIIRHSKCIRIPLIQVLKYDNLNRTENKSALIVSEIHECKGGKNIP